MVCCDALGKDIPPMIIYPHCLPRNAYNLVGPKGASYTWQETGWIDSDLMIEWIPHFVKHAPKERPLFLIMDQHDTHMTLELIELLRANRIVCQVLPGHCTHVLQVSLVN